MAESVFARTSTARPAVVQGVARWLVRLVWWLLVAAVSVAVLYVACPAFGTAYLTGQYSYATAIAFGLIAYSYVLPVALRHPAADWR